METVWILAGLNLALLGLLAWDTAANARQVRDLTAKLMSRDIYEYATVMEKKPVSVQKEKKTKLTDTVLGEIY